MRKQRREKAKALGVGIYQGQKLLKVVRIADPREVYCREFNAYSFGGHSAYPVSLATSTASDNRLSE